MSARHLCYLAYLLLAPACAVAASPDLGTESAGEGGAARAGGGALGGVSPGAGRAGSSSESAGNAGAFGAAAAGGSGAGSTSGAAGTGDAGAAQGGSAPGGQAGSASGGSAQGGAAAGSAGATSATCAPHVFTWADPQHALKSVAVTGSFNAWSTTGNALAYDASTQRWTLPLTMAAGTQQYKFIIDGSSAWKADPANPNTMADGFGGVNSVLDCL